jgi:hypothetical protein
MAATAPKTAITGAGSGTAPHGSLQTQKALRQSILATDDIFETAIVCRRRFDEYLQDPRLYSKQVTELQRQFLTWASFLGVFAPVSVCLDTRLADAPEIKELVISMLNVLKRNLERGISLFPLIIFQSPYCTIKTRANGQSRHKTPQPNH